DLGAWYVRGQQEMGVVAVAKHFPGHGDTREDSHYAMPSISADKTRLEEVELVPFARAMEAGLDAVMTAHISLPNVIKEKEMPATLSHEVLTDILRKRIGFDGIVVTDGLEMRGIIERFGSGKAAVMAILAGADMPMILWTTKKKEEVYQSLLSAVRSGKISMPRLEQSVRRILKVKSKRGLFDLRLEPYERVVKKRNRNPIHEQVAGRIAREAVTLVRNHGDLLPLRAIRYRKAVVLAPAGPFAKRLAQEPNVTVITTPYIPSRSTRKSIIKRVSAEEANADIFIAAVVNRYHLRMIKSISAAASHVPVAMVSLASPYYLSSVPDVDAYLCTYSYLDGAQEAAARAVLGESPMTGRLPISIPGYYPYGHRVEDRMAGAGDKRKDAEASLR
ncbi:beta-N-acetylhexosaminidase, partial [Myxococcota bacterium]|nr:beta-N-acetylhexosaminidase [Myxococcota bacterium]